MKKAQFTAFVVLGFVIFIVVSFFIFLVTSLAGSDYERQAREAVEEFLESGPINFYVNSCLELATKNAIKDVITHYDEQNFIQTTINGQQINITKAILNETSRICTPFRDYRDAPSYPFPRTKLSELRATYFEEDLCRLNRRFRPSGFFGFNNMVRLCQQPGPNVLVIEEETGEGEIRIIPPCFMSDGVSNTQLVADSQDQLSIENITMTTILEEMNECIRDFDVFYETQGHNITIIDDPSAFVIFQPETFSVTITYPFEVHLRAMQPITTSYNFTYNSDVRLTSVQRFLFEVIRRETQDIFFNLTRDYTSIPEFRSGFILNRTYKEDYSIINFTDEFSLIDGEELTYLLAIPYRKPALDYIRETNPGNEFDIIVVQNETIIIRPLGVDPDDRGVSYFYSGWKENRDEQFNFTRCNIFDPNFDFNLIPEDQGLQFCIDVFEDIEPKNWTQSPSFLETNRVASYKTDVYDIGPHNLTVGVRDKTGLIDFQLIKILVFDLPKVDLQIPPVYPGLPNNTISVEDPFVLDGSASIPPALGNSVIDLFTFKITREEIDSSGGIETILEYLNATNESVVRIPSSFNIRNIKFLNLTNTGLHKINLTIDSSSTMLPPGTNLQDSMVVEVDVKQCLPHRNDTNYAYPYSIGDPFFANHTCCSDNYNYLPSSRVCYQETMFGELQRLRSYAQVQRKEAALEETGLNPIFSESGVVSDNSAQRNNILKLDFFRRCDGTRGNICGGNVQAQYVTEVACNYNPSFDEQCSGPPVSSVSTNAPVCINYTLTTFERAFNLQDSTGVCNEDYKCSSTTQYDTGGTVLCQATCDGQGTCTRSANCMCDATQCNAECDGNLTFERQGTQCRFGCSNSCIFQSTSTLPCQGEFCYYNNRCRYNVQCTASGPVQAQGDFCERGLVTEVGVQYCIYGSASTTNRCTSDGTCNLNKDPLPQQPCPSGLSRQCNVNSGWQCV